MRRRIVSEARISAIAAMRAAQAAFGISRRA